VHVDEESIYRATNWWPGEEKEKKRGNLFFYLPGEIKAGSSEREGKKKEKRRRVVTRRAIQVNQSINKLKP
jgi:hypothetical protein